MRVWCIADASELDSRAFGREFSEPECARAAAQAGDFQFIGSSSSSLDAE